MKAFSLYIVVSLLLASCNLVGYNRLKSENISKIQRGVTTQREVESLLGAPIMRDHRADGSVTLIYGNTMQNIIPLIEPGIRTLNVVVGPNGIVKDFDYSDKCGGFMRYDIYNYPHL